VTYAEVEIETVCDTGSGGTPSRAKQDMYFGGIIPWVKSGELRESIITQTEESLTEAGLNESAAKLVPKDALLVALYGATVGRVGILGIEAATNQAVCHIIPDTSRVDHRYLFHALRSKVPLWLSQRVGGGQPNISQGVIKKTKIPLPPLSEQKRIAEILDRAEVLRSKRRAALALLDELTQSIFLDMFGDPSERIVSGGIEFGSIVEEFRYGTSNKSGSNGFLTLRIPNVIGASIELTDLKLVQVDDAEFSRLRLLHGDLLFVRTNGNPDNVGRCAVFEENFIADSGCDPKEFIYASYLIRARLKSSVMPVFIRELMLTFEGRKNLRAAAKTSAGQYNINTQGLGSLPIFVPPIDLQRIFVDRVQVVNGLKAVLEKSQSELDQLFASLQHRAFRGEL
jgi:type I restriction enzyme S subunit